MDKKFDIILSNPPWGQNIHYEFTQKYLDIADTVISIMPNSIVKRDTKHFKKYKEAYNDYLYDVEELDSKNFEDTNMQNCCIFCFSQDKEDLHIKYIDGKEEHIGGILEKDYSGFTDYEKEIVKYLYNKKPNIVDGKQVVNGVSPKKNLDGYINKMLSKLPDNKAYLVVAASDGSMQAKYFSSKIGQIFNNKEDFKDFLYERGGKLTHYMWFDNKQCAENAKSAMLRPVLRFPLVRIQDNQSLSVLHYRYIPDIDWEDDRVKTDEGLLEVCGCPKDKCKEYADYCRKVIEEKDTNGNGKFDINDFLEMDNNEILRENKGKKFDIVLMNPPYGTRTNKINFEFANKCLDISHKQISIMPAGFIKKDSYDEYKKSYNDYLYEIEEINSKEFEDTNMQNVAIYCFSDNKEDLHIKYIDGKEETISGILEKDYSGFTDYEKEIVKYLYNEKPNIRYYQPKKSQLESDTNKKINLLPDNKVYLTCNAADGSMSHVFFSSLTGQIFDNKEDLKENLIKRNGKICNIMWFNNITEATNCKLAMQRPLLRFSLTKTQTDQHLLVTYHYKYIPDIDWSNIESDYDILKNCNCPENKIEEYIQYVTNIINKKDRK